VAPPTLIEESEPEEEELSLRKVGRSKKSVSFKIVSVLKTC
jgi:hypothetical protein